MNKKFLVAAFVLMFVSGVSAQTLQNFEYSPADGFEQNLTGGDSFSVEADFTNAASRPVPMAVEVRVDGELPMSSSGDEFDLSASSVDAEGLEFSEFDYYRKNGVGVYTSTLNDTLSESFDSGVTLVFDSSQRIQPDSYSFDVKVKSEVGAPIASNNTTVNASQPAVVKAGSSSVTVNASSKANVTVQSLTSVSTQSPGFRNNYVGGVSVDVRNSSGDVESSGTVNITYSNNAFSDDDMAVYFYNETSSDWEFVGGTHYPANNSIVAEVDHFSTYAAYSRQPDDDDGDGGDDESSTEDQTQEDETTPVDSQPDQQDNQAQDDTPSDEGQNQTDEEQQQENQGADTGQEQTQPPEQPQSPPATGLFTADTTSVVGGLAFLLVVVAAVLQYTGRVNFREIPEKFRS